MNPPNSTPISVSVADAAKLTSLSEWEIRDAVNNLHLTARRKGRRILIDYAALLDWYRSLPAFGEAS